MGLANPPGLNFKEIYSRFVRAPKNSLSPPSKEAQKDVLGPGRNRGAVVPEQLRAPPPTHPLGVAGVPNGWPVARKKTAENGRISFRGNEKKASSCPSVHGLGGKALQTYALSGFCFVFNRRTASIGT